MRNPVTVLVLICTIAIALAACEEADSNTYQGYVEGEYIHVAPVQPGPVEAIHVRRGAWVEADTLLVDLDPATQQAQYDQARADFQLSQQQLERQRQLVKDNVISKDSLDAIIATHDRNRARLAETEWQLVQRKLRAPRAGTVEDVLYRPGEWVAAGRPIVTLCPRRM